MPVDDAVVEIPIPVRNKSIKTNSLKTIKVAFPEEVSEEVSEYKVEKIYIDKSLVLNVGRDGLYYILVATNGCSYKLSEEEFQNLVRV